MLFEGNVAPVKCWVAAGCRSGGGSSSPGTATLSVITIVFGRGKFPEIPRPYCSQCDGKEVQFPMKTGNANDAVLSTAGLVLMLQIVASWGSSLAVQPCSFWDIMSPSKGLPLSRWMGTRSRFPRVAMMASAPCTTTPCTRGVRSSNPRTTADNTHTPHPSNAKAKLLIQTCWNVAQLGIWTPPSGQRERARGVNGCAGWPGVSG